MEPIIVDNFLPKSFELDILNTVYTIPYMYYPKTTTEATADDNSRVTDNGQFVSLAYAKDEYNSPLATQLKPVLYYLPDCFGVELRELNRLKVNLQTAQPHFQQDHYNLAHIDNYVPNHYSLLYYPKDSDGDTVIFEQTWGDNTETLTECLRVTPVQGRAVLFPSNQFHASTSPRHTQERFTINFIFDIKL